MKYAYSAANMSMICDKSGKCGNTLYEHSMKNGERYCNKKCLGSIVDTVCTPLDCSSSFVKYNNETAAYECA